MLHRNNQDKPVRKERTMEFKATEAQIKKVAALAVNASSPIGMGVLHYKADFEFSPSDFEVDETGLHLDYVQGRMVKLNIRRIDGNTYKARDDAPTADYQSWVHKYPTYEALFSAAGIEP